MRVRLPIYARILLWFFLDLVLILVVLLFLFRLQFHAEAGSPLARMIGNRLQDVGTRIRDDMERTDPSAWDAILARYSEAHGVALMLYRDGGTRLAGQAVDLPPEIDSLLKRRSAVFKEFLPPPPGPAGTPPPDGPRPPEIGSQEAGPDAGPPPLPPRDPRDPRDPREHRPPGAPPGGGGPPREHGPGPSMRATVPMDFAIHTGNPSLYWAGMALPLVTKPGTHPIAAVLLARSDSISGHGLFFDATPWIIVLAAVILLSLLVWFPLVRNLTRPLREMTVAASQIAQGRFDTRLDDRRGDEIGALAGRINDMAGRLDVLVGGQKRFLSDVAHELASPIARIQLQVGILQNSPVPIDPGRLEELHQEVEDLAELVNEQLSFARAETSPSRIRLEPVTVLDVVQRALRRENRAGADVRVDLPPGLAALADPELLARALANLLRNALRYASGQGPIEIAGWADGGETFVQVRDSGPGVPPDHLDRIFEPFYRVETSRTRDCGGVGLGLAIVKTCVLACHGTVTAANRQPIGFVVTLALAHADPVQVPTT